jgi:hypothetical protein
MVKQTGSQVNEFETPEIAQAAAEAAKKREEAKN